MRKRTFLLALATTAVTVTTVAAALRGQGGPAQEKAAKRRPVMAKDYPIADYTEQGSPDPREGAKTKARAKRHNLPGDSAAKERFALNESSDTVILQLPSSHAPAEPALPLAQSDAVVVGQVTGARAHLSEDRTTVFSEFTVRVQEVLKGGVSAPLHAGVTITTERPGGRVRLPSGKILLRGGLYGKNMPRVKQRYVLFLKYNEGDESYSIITGYALFRGRVVPLDGFPREYGAVEQFAEYRRYDGTAEGDFMNELRAVVKQPAEEVRK